MSARPDDHAEPAPGERDPYRTLGVSQRASDGEVRRAYHRLAQLHHPDHNGGSSEAARRFAAIQEAYTTIGQLRRDGGGGPGVGSGVVDARRSTAPAGPEQPRPQGPFGAPGSYAQPIAAWHDHQAGHRLTGFPSRPSPRPHGSASGSGGLRRSLTQLFRDA